MSHLTPFTRHPVSVGETYGQHWVSASGFGWRLLLAGTACLIHAVLPFLFERTASRIITQLHARMVANRARHAVADRPAAEIRIAV